MRSGTENVPGMVGFGKAAELAGKELDSEARRIGKLRDELVTGILSNIEKTYLNGHPKQRLPNNANISFSFVEGEPVCLNLDLANICVSTGSACSSASTEASHVLLALGIPPELARSAIRFSYGKWSTEEDNQRVMAVLPRTVSKLRAISPLYQK